MKVIIKLMLVISCLSACQAADTILCYFESWAQWHTGNGKFVASDVPPAGCSHVVYTFILPAPGGAIQNFQDADTLNTLVGLKSQNPNLKVTAAIGGWNAGSTDFSNNCADDGTRGTFVNAISDFLDQYQLDGIDIDWEYPAQRGGGAADLTNYISFLSDLRAKLGDSKLITVAVGAGLPFIGTSYDVQGINQYVDYINLMTYDFHAYWDQQTGQNSPLYDTSNPTFNADASVTGWIGAGATPSKILLGLGFYGHNFQLADPSNNGVGAASSGPGQAGPFTQQAGFKSYLEICSDLAAGGWNTVYDSDQVCPYSYNGDQWVGYDNVQSITAKTQYAVDKGLAGVMMWAIDNDDLNNVCGFGSLPLLNAVKSIIQV